MAVSSTTSKVSYAGNGSTTVFAYTFKIFADEDLRVFIRDAAGTETLKTLTTDYTVSNAGSESGGNVTFGIAPASGETVVIQRVVALTQGTDYVENDPFPAESHEDALDRLTFITQQLQEEVDRSIKASVTNTISSTEFTISAADRADKIFAFDASGDLSVTQELGTFRGDWSSGTAFAVRDLVKDTSTNNIFLANTAHTSSGSQPITTNPDSAKWDLIVDAASATASATAASNSASAAASSATDAETAQTAAESAQTDAESAKTAAEAAQTAAETAQTNAETAESNAEAAVVDFRDTYYGAFADDSAAETYQTNTNGGTVDAGDLYFNTTSGTLKIYNGSTWQDAALTAAGFLTVANNLSDLDNAATARQNLGVEIGVDVQAYDAGLNYLDGLDFTDESTFKAAVNLEIGTDVQAFDADTVKKDVNNTFTAAQRGSTDTDTTNTGSVTLDFDTNQNFVLTLTGNVTLANPTTETVGQSGFIVFIQDGTGGRTVSLGTDYETAGGAGLTLSTAASATDVVPYIVAASGRILLGTPQLAFA